jgi:hypothetical protein
MLRIFVLFLEALFGLGVVGSAIVVIWTFIEDVRELGPDREPQESDASARE